MNASPLILLLIIFLGGTAFMGSMEWAKEEERPAWQQYLTAVALGWMLPYLILGGSPVEETSFGIALATCAVLGVYFGRRKDRGGS